MVSLLSAAVALLLLVIGCAGGSGSEPGQVSPGVGVGTGVGPGISVGEALASRLEGPLLVRGWLWRASGGDLRLCAALTDSIPPQCTKPWLTVKGLDLSKIQGLRTEGRVTWSLEQVLVLGTRSGGVLQVSGLMRG